MTASMAVSKMLTEDETAAPSPPAAAALVVAAENGGNGDEEEANGVLTLKKKKSVGKQLAELHLPPMKEQLPYETLEVLVNHENIWANLQGHNLTGSSFNLEDTDRWHPFIDHGEDGWVPPAPPRPFYSVGRIGPAAATSAPIRAESAALPRHQDRVCRLADNALLTNAMGLLPRADLRHGPRRFGGRRVLLSGH